MSGLETRGFERPDESLALGDRGHAGLVNVGGKRVWRAVANAGWRYTDDTDGELCPAPHLAYVVSGRLGIAMQDGTEAETGPGEVVFIEPGHDAWTVGDEPCVFVDFGESLLAAAPGAEEERR